jgi:hypothetical protein
MTSIKKKKVTDVKISESESFGKDEASEEWEGPG